ncbi:MAG: hypothetical protein K9J12_11940 [Melioribacteraceae bacterium]|nr:hypothetical protein [Melioribacteraceae bacterium]MCF8262890.1 hypothetical protein [Melioribacteraceae bacterium]MCF8430912.1 hypothetical protein [Melioribacteraceae bacterium]
MSEKSVEIKNIILTEEGRNLEFDVIVKSKIHHLYFRSKSNPFTPSTEAYIIMALLPAMKSGQDIVTEGDVDSRFNNSLKTIQSIFINWLPHQQLRRFSLPNNIKQIENKTLSDRGLACFSGGLDSFYTLLKNKTQITDLLFIKGFGKDNEDPKITTKITNHIHSAAMELDKNVIEISTNLRPFLTKFFPSKIIHGAMLASIGHLFSGTFSSFFIPTSTTYNDLTPWGSHPLLDPLWSTNFLEVINDGSEADRIQKLRMVSEFEFVLNNLRVCNNKSDLWLNCGECEKCIRTMAGLLAIDKLDNCKTFNNKLSTESIRRLHSGNVLSSSVASFYPNILYELEKNEANYDLCYEISQIVYNRNLSEKLRDSLKNYLRRYKYRFPKIYKLFRE